MGMTEAYAATEPTRAEIDALEGPALLEFGSVSCGWCIRAQSLLKSAFAMHPSVRHIKVEDGSGQPIGRSFAVKLWPTLSTASIGWGSSMLYKALCVIAFVQEADV